VRGKPNQPSYVVHTAAGIAVERRVPYQELEAAVEATAASLFGW
jgi:Tat protein secretion system quality control protein TatD with DNase activity